MYAPGGFRAWELSPKNWRKIETNKIVERASREIGFNQGCVDITGVLHRLSDRGFGYCVKCNAANGGIFFDRPTLCQRFLQVPADRLSLAIRVGRKDQRVVIFQCVRNGLDVFFALTRDFPNHFESIVGINGSILWRQIPDVSVGCENRVVGPQIFVYCLGLSRGFDDDDWHMSPWILESVIGRATCGSQQGIVNPPVSATRFDVANGQFALANNPPA